MSRIELNKEMLRWLLVIPAAFVGWYAAFFVEVILYVIFESMLCPEQLPEVRVNSFPCEPIFSVMVTIGAGLSAVLTILFAVWVAPARRVYVAAIIYTGGAAFALYFAVLTSEWAAFASAMLCGAVMVAVVLLWWSRQAPEVVERP